MLEITYNNVVSPVRPEVMGIKLVTKANKLEANKNGYFEYIKLSPFLLSLIVSTSNKNSRYFLTKGDEAKGFYFIYTEAGFDIKVPLNVVFNTNEKIAGILGVAFSTAKDCPSRKLGYCQLEDTEICYARSGEKQSTNKAGNHLNGMDGLNNAILAEYYWELFKGEPEVRLTFLKYCMYYNIKIIRFNLKGDFKNSGDINALLWIANNTNIKLYGYTARDDLKNGLNKLMKAGVIINGSNQIYNNRFMATDSLYIYLNAKYNCKGECLKCGNCRRNLKNNIICLIHGSGSDSKLKTGYNIAYLCELLNKKGLNIKPEELHAIKNKGLKSTLNKWLKSHGYKAFEGQGSALVFRNYLIKLHKEMGGL